MSRWLVPALAAAILVYLARSVLSPFIIAGALAYMFSPVVDQIQTRSRLARLPVTVLLCLTLFAVLGVTIWLLETRLVHEIADLSAAGPDIADAAFVRLLGNESFQFLGQRVDPHELAVRTNSALDEFFGSPTDAFHVAERALDAVVKTLLTMLAFFYFLLDGHRLGRYLLRFIPLEHRPHVTEVAARIHVVLGRFLRGQLLLIILMSSVTYLVLGPFLHLPFALPVAVITGVLEVIPILGPVVATTIAALVAVVNGGPGLMLGVVIAYTVLRQLEDQLVMPIVVGRAVHLHPLVTTFAVLVGGTSAGVLGAVMAVPVAAAIRVTLDYAFPDPSDDQPAGTKRSHVSLLDS